MTAAPSQPVADADNDAPGQSASRLRALRRRGIRLVTVLHDWAESGWSRSAMMGWGVLQGSVVPGPCDALLIPLGLADPPRAFTLAAWAIAGSILGGTGAYLLGAHAFGQVGHAVLAWVGVSASQLQASRSMFDRYGGAIVALSAMIPVPTKWMCIAAGVFGVPFPEFAIGITVGRTVRFLAVATVLRFAGERLTRWMARRTGEE